MAERDDRLSKEEFLKAIARRLQRCPLCGADADFKVSGFLGKMLECSNCKGKWSGGTTTEGTQWLMLGKPSTTGTGKYLVNKAFPLEFWLDPEKPFLKYNDYAKAIHDAFEDMEKTPSDGYLGKAFFSGSHVSLMGPSIDQVVEIFPSAEEKDVTVKVVDLTVNFDEKKHRENDWFYFEISKRLSKLSNQMPVEPYVKTGKEVSKVEENRFYPFKERDVVIPEETMRYLVRYGVLEPVEEST